MYRFLDVLPGEHFIVAEEPDMLFRKLSRYGYKIIYGPKDKVLNGTEMCQVMDPLRWSLRMDRKWNTDGLCKWTICPQ